MGTIRHLKLGMLVKWDLHRLAHKKQVSKRKLYTEKDGQPNRMIQQQNQENIREMDLRKEVFWNDYNN